jgi:predicted amidohydrolase YtcJ
MTIWRTVAVPLLLFAESAALAAPELIIVNAKVFTADPRRPFAQAVAIERGKVSSVGSTSSVRKLADGRTRIVEAQGRLLVPGLTEAHVHVMAPFPGEMASLPNLPFPGPTPDEALAAIKAAYAKGGTGWIGGMIGPPLANAERNWRRELDAVAPDRPVLLRAWWGHGSFYNSAALKTLGVTEDVLDPAGGWYGRDAAGRLNGRVFEAAEVVLLRRMLPKEATEQLATSFRESGRQYARWGVTSVHHMGTTLPLPETVAALRASNSPIRYSLYAWGSTGGPLGEIWPQVDAHADALSGRLRLAGTKWVLDATPLERFARLREPYADKPGWRGRSNYTEAELHAILTTALTRGEGLALHVVGDAEVERLLGAMERLAPARRWAAKRVRIEHGDGLAPDLLQRAQRLGVVLVQNPLHIEPAPAEGGKPVNAARLGDERAKERMLLKSLVRAGIPLALGSDAGGKEANPFLNMMLAAAYRANPSEALSRQEALLAYTSGGAYAEGQEKVRGAIRAGLVADLALLSQDVLTVPLNALPSTISVLTIVGGEIVHEAPGLRSK